MEYPAEQIEELKAYCNSLGSFREEERTFFRFEGLALPEGCAPASLNAVLQPTEGNGYKSRMYYSQKVVTMAARNWNLEKRLNEENWHSFSWDFDPTGMTLAQILLEHLKALVRG